MKAMEFTLIDHAKALAEGLEIGHKENPTAGLDHAARNVRFVLGKLETLAERERIAAENRKAKEGKGFDVKAPIVEPETEDSKPDPEVTEIHSNAPAKNPNLAG